MWLIPTARWSIKVNSGGVAEVNSLVSPAFWAAMAEGGARDIFYKNRRSNRIRPRPNIILKKGAKFAMCNGTTCRGENCTFAHNPEEMRIWNSQLSDFDGKVLHYMY